MITIPQDMQGLIFDLDGTLVDSLPLHYEAWSYALAKYDYTLSKSDFKDFTGMPTIKIVEQLNEQYKLSLDPQVISQEKSAYFNAHLSVRTLPPITSITQVVWKYHTVIPMGIGTGGNRETVQDILKVLNMEGLFHPVITADDVTHHKPHPETFLKCAEQMGVRPEKCVVFEDGELGMRAARELGMTVVDVNEYFSTTVYEE